MGIIAATTPAAILKAKDRMVLARKRLLLQTLVQPLAQLRNQPSQLKPRPARRAALHRPARLRRLRHLPAQALRR